MNDTEDQSVDKVPRALRPSVVFLAILGGIAIGVLLIWAGLSLSGRAGHVRGIGDILHMPSWAGISAPRIESDKLYRAIRVVDGDTLIADISGTQAVLRLIGIDTPETVDPRKPVGCYGPEASHNAKELLEGKGVYIELDPMKKSRYDKYRRTLAYVRLADGTSYNLRAIEQGFAHEYTYSKEPYTHQSEYKEAEKKARQAKLGLWNPTTCKQATNTI